MILVSFILPFLNRGVFIFPVKQFYAAFLVFYTIGCYFATDSNKIIEMKKELMAEEYSHIQKMAHELVSISGTYGFRGLSEILRTIEQAAIRSDKKIMGDGIGLAVKQWQEIQGPLADFMADCGVHDGE